MTSKKKILKIVLVGNQCAGKTCLFCRVTKKMWNPNTRSTLNFHASGEIIVSLECGDHVRICLWDLIGDDRFQTPTRQFTRNASAAIICCSLNDNDFDLEKAKFWTHIVKKDAPDCKIYLVGTKCDLPIVPSIKSALQEYSTNYSAKYFETSSKKDINITELIKTIAEDLYSNLQASHDADVINLDVTVSKKKKSCC